MIIISYYYYVFLNIDAEAETSAANKGMRDKYGRGTKQLAKNNFGGSKPL